MQKATAQPRDTLSRERFHVQGLKLVADVRYKSCNVSSVTWMSIFAKWFRHGHRLATSFRCPLEKGGFSKKNKKKKKKEKNMTREEKKKI